MFPARDLQALAPFCHTHFSDSPLILSGRELTSVRVRTLKIKRKKAKFVPVLLKCPFLGSNPSQI
jgi:hypothetical protein